MYLKLVYSGSLVAALMLAMAACAPRVAHKELSENQVGLAALQEENVRSVVFGPQIQGYVSSYPLFAEVLNTEIVGNLGGYTERYNVYSREKLTYPETGLVEVDPFLVRATKATATVRVGTRLLNYVGLRLKHLSASEKAAKDSKEILYTMTPEELSLAVQAVRDSKGMLSREQKRQLAMDIVAISADAQVVTEAANQAEGLLVEGENLRAMLSSAAFAAELKAREPEKAKLLPEVISNLHGVLGGLRVASNDGKAIARNARVWTIYLADAMQ